MTLSIDSTISGVNANSYATIAVLDDLIYQTVQDTAWFALGARGVETEPKIAIAIKAARILTVYMRYKYYPTKTDQALPFPAVGVPMPNNSFRFYPDDAIPSEMIYAQAELCRFLAASDRTLADPTAEIQTDSLGSMSTTYFKSGWKHQIIPDSVFQMISFLGCRVGSQPIEIRR